MTYSPTYTTADIVPIVIDFVATYAVQFVLFAGLIALAVIGVWFLRKSRQFGGLGGR